MTLQTIIRKLGIDETFASRPDVMIQHFLSYQHNLDFDPKKFDKMLRTAKKQFQKTMAREEKEYGHVLAPLELYDVMLNKKKPLQA